MIHVTNKSIAKELQFARRSVENGEKENERLTKLTNYFFKGPLE